MPKYKVSVDLLHTFTELETYECEITASNEAEALRLGEDKARDGCDPDCWEADHDSTDINGSEAEIIEGTEIEPPYRCDKTPDMFEGICPK